MLKVSKQKDGDRAGQALIAGQRTIDVEIAALTMLRQSLTGDALASAFVQAVELIVSTKGRVVVTGMGKSGLVGRKIAATLASTGNPAFFLHPAEAGHGDLGMITKGDVVLALSWSGETSEISDILSYCRRFDIELVVVTAQPQSTLAKAANIVLALPKAREACPNRLTPTSSTLLQSAMGDALAIALIEARGFSADEFRIFHPKGSLGAQLLRVGDIMAVGDAIPTVGSGSTILAAMLEMTRKRFGITGVVDGDGRLVGGFSDGDLRRTLTRVSIEAPVDEHMTREPLVADHQDLVSQALATMNKHSVLQLFVTEDERLVGIVHIHDILRAGVA